MSTTTQYDLRELYKLAFGYARPPYPTEVLASKTIGISPGGTIKALGGVFKFSSKIGNEYTMPLTLDGYQIPQEPSVWIQGSKNVIETPLNRGNEKGIPIVWNVLEEVNLNNYRVRLRGVIINEDDFDEYPLEAVSRLREICVKPGAVKIENALTSIHNITMIEIIGFNFFEVVGNVSAQAFELDCLSVIDGSFDVPEDNNDRTSL